MRFWLPAGLYLSALIASSAYLSACSKSFSCKTAKQTTVYNLYQSKNWSFLCIFKIFFLDSISLKQHHSNILNVKSYWMDEYWAILIIKPVYNIMKSTIVLYNAKKRKKISIMCNKECYCVHGISIHGSLSIMHLLCNFYISLLIFKFYTWI